MVAWWKRNFVILIMGNLFGLSVQVVAQPVISIILVEPDVRGQQIELDSDVREIKCAVRTSPPGVQVQWSLNGPGEFDGETTGLASIYRLPLRLSTPEADVTITATATDSQGNTAQDTLTFTLLNSQSVETPTPTPHSTATPIPQPTATPRPTATPVPQPTATPTATPAPDTSQEDRRLDELLRGESDSLSPTPTPSPTPQKDDNDDSRLDELLRQ